MNVFTGGRGQASHAPLSSVPAHSPWQHESQCTTYIVLFIGGPSRTSVLIKMIKFFGSGKKTVCVYIFPSCYYYSIFKSFFNDETNILQGGHLAVNL